MYIISKRKDYYDGVAGTTGIDKTIVYNRDIIELDEEKYPKIFRRYHALNNTKPSPFYRLSNVSVKKELKVVYEHVAPFIIGFCGKIYVGWKFYSVGEKKPYVGDELITTIDYNNDNIKKIVEQFSWWGGNLEDSLNYVLSYDAMDIFRELNTPVFVYDSDYGRYYREKNYHNNPKFFINPLLKEYQFFKVFNAFQAFQEIQMFLSGVLGNKEKDIVNVDDKYKIAQHGFDKWSFRKEPEKK
ncbi:MAG TPA: hypothetical protein PK698_01685 [Bacilli bacterium]|nr:hypothetical protein [Bacilli bacterium]